MMADLRYLLAIYVHAHRTGNSVPPHIDAEARWHLGLPVSDEPAVPQGREPAAVTGQPSDGEVAELVETLKGIAYWRLHGKPGDKPAPFDIRQAARLTRAAELLERLSPPQPVPVSERPWEREGWCDPGGLCWLGSDALDGCTPTWLYGSPAWAERFPNVHRVSLPAHALPLPEVDE